MFDTKAIVSILIVVLSAVIAFPIFEYERIAQNAVTSTVEQNLPQTTAIIEQGQQVDNVKSNVEDLNHAKTAYNTGTFSSNWSFASPFAIVIVAGVAIWRIIKRS